MKKRKRSIVSASSRRVIDQTQDTVNLTIRQETERSIAYFLAHRDQIPRRLKELDEEWDIERMLETGSSCLSLFGLTRSLFNRKWILLPMVVQAFFLQHAVQGWCPPLPVLRRLGFRTASEIAIERYALKAIRGDFEPVKKDGKLDQVLDAVR